MSRLLTLVAALLLVVPAYGQCGLRSYGGCGSSSWGSYGGCGGSWSSYGGCGTPTSYGGCGGYVSSYGDCGSCGGYVSSGCGVSNSCGSATSTSSSPVQAIQKEQSTPLPPDYYQEPAKAAEPTPAEPSLPKAPAESFQSTSYHTTSLEKPVVRTGDGIIELHVSPTAQVWINGHKTSQTGAVRRYLSKGLKEGRQYTYDIVVLNNGHKGHGVAVLKAGQTKVVH